MKKIRIALTLFALLFGIAGALASKTTASEGLQTQAYATGSCNTLVNLPAQCGIGDRICKVGSITYYNFNHPGCNAGTEVKMP